MKVFLLIVVAILTFLAGNWLGAVIGNDQGKAHLDLSTSATVSSAAGSQSDGKGSFTLPAIKMDATDDPFGKLISITQEPGMLNMHSQLAEAVQGLDASQCEALLMRASRLEWKYRIQLIPAIMDRWLDLDRQAVANWLQSSKSYGVYTEIYASKDPDRAIAIAIGTEKDNYRSYDLLTQAVRAKAHGSLAQQCQILQGLPAGHFRDMALRDTLAEWSKQNPGSAAAFFEKLPPGEIRNSMLTRVAESMAESDPVAALELVQRQPEGKEKQEALETALVALVKNDPNRALDEMNSVLPSLPTGLLGNPVVARFADGLAGKDLNAARTWVESLPSEMGPDPVIAVARAWAKTEPVAALEWAIAHGADVTRGLHDSAYTWTGCILGEAMLKHPEETVEWVRSQPAGPERDRLIERALMERVGNLKPDQLFTDSKEISITLFADLPQEAQPRAARSLATKRAARSDFTDLQEWAVQFPSGPARREATAAAMETVAKGNLPRAQEMLDNIKDPELHDAAVIGMVSVLGSLKPETASAQALAIHDASLRFDALDQFIPDWLRRDPKAAQTWMSQAAIPAAWKAGWQAETKKGI